MPTLDVEVASCSALEWLQGNDGQHKYLDLHPQGMKKRKSNQIETNRIRPSILEASLTEGTCARDSFQSIQSGVPREASADRSSRSRSL